LRAGASVAKSTPNRDGIKATPLPQPRRHEGYEGYEGTKSDLFLFVTFATVVIFVVST